MTASLSLARSASIRTDRLCAFAFTRDRLLAVVCHRLVRNRKRKDYNQCTVFNWFMILVSFEQCAQSSRRRARSQARSLHVGVEVRIAGGLLGVASASSLRVILLHGRDGQSHLRTSFQLAHESLIVALDRLEQRLIH